ALTTVELEFSIPDLVRAAEGVLGMDKKNVGAPVFKQRALRLVPQLKSDLYVGGEIEDLLLELYRHRNDCLHGKIPFLNLKALGEAGVERASQIAYVADVLARE